MIKILISLILLLSLPVYAESPLTSILKGIKPESLTIIGETHKRPESYRLFQSLIDAYLEQHRCLTVALEIASNQQEVINRFIENKAKVSDIKVAPPIDHPEFRTLIENLAELQRQNACFKLIAVDADIKLKTDRDAWMAKELTMSVEKKPILVLLGSLHGLKKVNWNPEIGKKSLYVAEILIEKGYDVQTYLQIWKDSNCNAHYRFISSDESEATELVTSSLFAVLNATKPTNVSHIIDGIILWECGNNVWMAEEINKR